MIPRPALYAGLPVAPTKPKVCKGCGASGEYAGGPGVNCPACCTPDVLDALKGGKP